jgi:hypothetical protein
VLDLMVITGVVQGLTLTKSGFQGSAPSTVSTSWRCTIHDKQKNKKKVKKKSLITKSKVFIGSRIANSQLLGLTSDSSSSSGEQDNLKRSLTSSSSSSSSSSSPSSSSNKRSRTEEEEEEDDDEMMDEDGLYDDDASTTTTKNRLSRSGASISGGTVLHFEILDCVSPFLYFFTKIAISLKNESFDYWHFGGMIHIFNKYFVR